MDTRSFTAFFATAVLILAGTTFTHAQTTMGSGSQMSGQPSQGIVVQPGGAVMPNQPMPGGGMQPSIPQGGAMPGMQQPMPGGGMPMPGGMQPPTQGIAPATGPQGTCVMKISEDRTSVSLVDQTGQQVSHVALGQDRIQKIFNAPDGSWSVVVYKVRRVSQFGGIAINLAQCQPQEAREFQAVPEAIEFQGEEMAVRYPGGSEERYPLGNKRLP
jgi:hypothetical protein